MKKKISIGILVILVIGLGIFSWDKFFNQESTVANNRPSHQKVRPNMVMTVEKASLEKTVEASGKVESIESQELYFRTNGTIKSINIEEGAKVTEDQVLMELDNDEKKLDYLRAKNNYEEAVINGTKSGIEEAELSLKIAKDKLEETKLKAPFSGIVNQISVEEDSYTQLDQGKTVAKIIDDSSYQVEISVDESDSRQIKLDQQALITLEALLDQQFKGQVIDIGANAQSESGVVTLPVTVSITEKPEFIKPGFSADVEIIVNQIEDQLLVPITAIFNEEGQTKAVKVVNGELKPVTVKTGITNGERIEIKSGLEPGDKILINTYTFANSDQETANNQLGGGMIPGGGRMMRGGGR